MKKIQYSLVVCGLFAHGFVKAEKLQAQIVPDATLPQPSIVEQNTIKGGTSSGTTLFHSFRSFSIPTGSTAQFLPSDGIQNIITRITGSDRSFIDGLLSVSGTANLFFLNPNGITFGRNARLGINGSFIASTADRLKFSNGSEYSTKTPQAPPLLTISTPVGLQFGDRPGSIVNQARLTLPPARTLGLAGGEIQFDNGSYTSLGGNLFAISAIAPGTVGIAPDLSLGESRLTSLGKIELAGTSAVNVGGFRGGAIQIRGGDVIMRDRATISSDTVGFLNGRDIEIQADRLRLQDQAAIRAFTIGIGAGGNINLRATDTIELVGTGYAAFEQNYLKAAFDRTVQTINLESAILAGTIGTGRSGNLTVEAQQLSLSQGAVLGSPTQGSGKGGDVSIRVADTTQITSSAIATTTTASGKAGDLLIQTGRLNLDLTGVLTTTTLGDGDSGKITIQAKDTVNIRGQYPGALVVSTIATGTFAGAGNAGSIDIHSRSIQLENGGTIQSQNASFFRDRLSLSSGAGGDVTLNALDEIRLAKVIPDSNASIIVSGTVNAEKAGDITINTRRLFVLDDSQIEASTGGTGQGGAIHINASESVELSSDRFSPFGIRTGSGRSDFENFLGLTFPGTGGDIKIRTSLLSIRNGRQIGVESVGSGAAGTIQVNANTIRLDNNARIDALTNTGGKGNIDLQAQNIFLRRGSRILANAGRSDGGNIDIRAGLVFAVPSENSDITANAAGRGGNINITAQGIFGFQQGRSLPSSSDITASSEIGLDGAITLTTFGTEPKVTAEIPVNLIDSSDRIAQTCAKIAKNNQFVITQRQGLEPPISEIVQSTPVWQDQRGGQAIESEIKSSKIVEATQWIRQSDGSIALVTDTPHAQKAVDCSAGESK
ncbi:MAG: filamentous hemagglutinin N-terminal domain-containing protein [Leptolyngbya sp. Prado105]|nr:filamentous hemagglutinin N-terminal domain-containing protein [Leptolyngbya sp. Prado105]